MHWLDGLLFDIIPLGPWLAERPLVSFSVEYLACFTWLFHGPHVCQPVVGPLPTALTRWSQRIALIFPLLLFKHVHFSSPPLLTLLLRNKMAPLLAEANFFVCALVPTPCRIPHYFVSSLSYFSSMFSVFQVFSALLCSEAHLFPIRSGAHLFPTPNSTVLQRLLITSSPPNVGMVFLSISLHEPSNISYNSRRCLVSILLQVCLLPALLHSPFSFLLSPMLSLCLFSPGSHLEFHDVLWFNGEHEKLHTTLR